MEGFRYFGHRFPIGRYVFCAPSNNSNNTPYTYVWANVQTCMSINNATYSTAHGHSIQYLLRRSMKHSVIILNVIGRPSKSNLDSTIWRFWNIPMTSTFLLNFILKSKNSQSGRYWKRVSGTTVRHRVYGLQRPTVVEHGHIWAGSFPNLNFIQSMNQLSLNSINKASSD